LEVKVKGIVISEKPYKENDKIIILVTDKLGKISVFAKGARKATSSFLASSSYLVYSEFVLFKKNNYYYISSCSLINSFYNLKIDLEKLEVMSKVTKKINKILYEGVIEEGILKLLLNTVFLIDKDIKNSNLYIAIFYIKISCILGESPNISFCENCRQNKKIYYEIYTSKFLCNECLKKIQKKKTIELSLR